MQCLQNKVVKDNSTHLNKLHTYSEHIKPKCFGPEAASFIYQNNFSEDLLLEIKNMDYVNGLRSDILAFVFLLTINLKYFKVVLSLPECEP